jgi:hypothetical protein
VKLSMCGAALVAAGCAANSTGHVTASAEGDVSHPAKRGSPTETLEQACGGPGDLLPDATSRIVRTPYLQQLTTSSVIIGWLSKDGSSERVDVTRPDGTAVVNAAAEMDRTARQSGDKQMWATVKGLEPDTIYCYTLAAGSTDLSQRIGFRTAPDANTTRKVSFLAFGDSGGGGSDQFALVDQMSSVPYDFIIHTGDLAYDQGTLAQFEDTVFAVYGDLFRHLAFFPSAGNHDYDTMQGAPFREVFNLPGSEKWYSYDYGPIHFAALDTESDYAAQAKWLDEDLAASKAPWKIIYLHKPPYSSGEHGSDTRLRALIAPIAERRGVELVLAGHDHDYERMTPQNGVEYVVTGGGGKGTRPVSKSGFTAFSIDVIHFVYVEVEGDKLTLHAIDGTGNEFDSVVVPRKG